MENEGDLLEFFTSCEKNAQSVYRKFSLAISGPSSVGTEPLGNGSKSMVSMLIEGHFSVLT